MKYKVLWAGLLLVVGFQLGLRSRGPVVVAEGGQGGIAAGCGDVNGDGTVDISDAVFLLNFLFSGGPPPTCPPPDCLNLVALPIDCQTDIAIDCAGGNCVNTFTFRVQNTGSAAVGPVTIHVTIDPAFVTDIVVTLAPGINTFMVSTPAGPLCYDPNCTVSFTVDSTLVIPETNELDNEQTLECIG